MVGHVINVLVIIAVGVIIADMVANAPGTKALFDGMGGIWKTGVNGMLGQPTK
jgi:hypothetical protein